MNATDAKGIVARMLIDGKFGELRLPTASDLTIAKKRDDVLRSNFAAHELADPAFDATVDEYLLRDFVLLRIGRERNESPLTKREALLLAWLVFRGVISFPSSPKLHTL